jgi:hypothetical protein
MPLQKWRKGMFNNDDRLIRALTLNTRVEVVSILVTLAGIGATLFAMLR